MGNLLQLNDVSLVYKINNKSLQILKRINFSLKSKESISIVGESGSGKTSLIMLIAGLERITSGKLVFDNQNIETLSEDQLSSIRKKDIGIIFQSFFLLPNLTTLENVNIVLEINNIKNSILKSKEILEKVGLKNRFDHYPSQLSGGEQQRVAIARSLVSKPKLLLADEPTGNLDGKNSMQISNMLFNIVKEENTSLILVTHDQKIANRADRKIIIHDGKLI